MSLEKASRSNPDILPQLQRLGEDEAMNSRAARLRFRLQPALLPAVDRPFFGVFLGQNPEQPSFRRGRFARLTARTRNARPRRMDYFRNASPSTAVRGASFTPEA